MRFFKVCAGEKRAESAAVPILQDMSTETVSDILHQYISVFKISDDTRAE